MLKQFLREEEGQSTVEYLLIIAVVVAVVALMGKNLQKSVGDLTTTIFSNINKKVGGLMGGAQ